VNLRTEVKRLRKEVAPDDADAVCSFCHGGHLKIEMVRGPLTEEQRAALIPRCPECKLRPSDYGLINLIELVPPTPRPDEVLEVTPRPAEVLDQ
jgi:hypothetical protein